LLRSAMLQIILHMPWATIFN